MAQRTNTAKSTLIQWKETPSAKPMQPPLYATPSVTTLRLPYPLVIEQYGEIGAASYFVR
eukprot:m.202561 g.202561  ORF g.202561 m.202561 type:complete len:60 (+) comp15751_c0_seq8:4561-4740(+)